MQLDTTLSLDIVIAVVAIFGAVWQLNRDIDKKIAALRSELKSDYVDLREELKADNDKLRTELKADISELRKDVKALDDKLDDSNQRIARLEGVILSREGLIDAITEAEATD
ncbi:MAG: hypothetical protein OXI77_10060 [Chloroflexota bacterium]|nr:hypothetical protein [Chloroflexota bacterium]MDE2909200.1 hypothetical protein [Chloroflexota bacterium]